MSGQGQPAMVTPSWLTCRTGSCVPPLVGAFRICRIRQRLMRAGVPALSGFTLWIGGEGGHS